MSNKGACTLKILDEEWKSLNKRHEEELAKAEEARILRNHYEEAVHRVNARNISDEMYDIECIMNRAEQEG